MALLGRTPKPAPAPDRTIKRGLDIRQVYGRVTYTVEVPQDVVVNHLWLKDGNDVWYPIAAFAPIAVTTSKVVHQFAVSLRPDDPLYAERLSAVLDEQDPEDVDEEGRPIARLNFFFEIDAPPEYFEDGLQAIDRVSPLVVNGRKRAFLAMGKFKRTTTMGLEPFRIGEHTGYVYSTKFGNLSYAINAQPSAFNSVHLRKVEITKGDVMLEGVMFTRHYGIQHAWIELRGREYHHTTVVRVHLKEDKNNYRKHNAHHRYTYTARIKLSKLAQPGRVDDILDAYMVTTNPDYAEPHAARIGRTTYQVRRKAKEGWAEDENGVVLASPYFTAKLKRLSFFVEHFSTEQFGVLQDLIAGRRLPQVGLTKPVWLIGEQIYRANDTGIAFFRYMRREHPEIDAYYVVDASVAQGLREEGLDHVVDHRSVEHLDLTFCAERIAGSHHPDYVYPSRSKLVQEQIEVPKIFLQHGVISIKRVEALYSRDSEGFDTDVFNVSSQREKEVIVNDFGYRPEDVAVTGLSRFDTLFAGDVEKVPGQVLVMPTWRDWLHDEQDLLDSEFLAKWQEVLGAEDFSRILEDNGGRLSNFMHPNMSRYMPADLDLLSNPTEDLGLQYLMKQSSVLITDYSSVAWDFSFLEKPVIFYQFDSERFLAKGSHIDLDAELPGPIFYDAPSLLAYLEKILADGGRMEEKYRKRAIRLNDHRDTHNCDRIFATIRDAKRSPRSVLERNADFIDSTAKALQKRSDYREKMNKAYQWFQKMPINENLVVFEAGLGKQVSGNPKAIYDELVARGDTRKKVWIGPHKGKFHDANTVVVDRFSHEYYWYLATAKYWISDQNLPGFITRRKECVYVQTWHGTPLKKMFFDLEVIHGRDSGYGARVSKAINQWTHLVSPSPYATSVFASAFRHKAKVMEIGYPRNDALFAEATARRAARLRSRLGIGEGKKTVLYAPTFRDSDGAGGGKFWFRPPFTFPEMADALGEDTVLLVRLHVHIKNKPVIPPEYEGRIIDVSKVEDLDDLLVASDAMISDYSSIYFDYSILGRPIVFFPYDYAKYAEELRGFYLDYPGDLPGPMVTTLSEVGEALDEQFARMPIDRSVFLSRFAPYDDGRASQRLVDAIFGSRKKGKGRKRKS